MKNLGYLIGGKSFSGLLGLAYLAFAVRSIGVAAYGQLVLVYAFALTVSTVVKFQSWQPILHYGTQALKAGRIEDFRRLILFTLLLDGASALVGTVVAVGGIWIFGPWIGLSHDIALEASLFGFALIFMQTGTANGLLRLFDRFDLLLLEDNTEAAVRFVGSLLFFLIGGTLRDFLLVWFLSLLASGSVCCGLAWYETRKHVPGGGLGPLWRAAMKSRGRSLTQGFTGIWKFVWSTNANSTLGMLTKQVSLMVVGGFLGPAEAGLFRIAKQIADAIAKPVKLMSPVFYPELARLVASRDYGLLRTLNRRASLISCSGALAGFVLLCLIGDYVLKLVGGHATEGAYTVMLLLSGAAFLQIGTFTYEPTLISLGRPTTALVIQIVAAVVYLPSLVAFVRMSGIEGAGEAAIFAALLTAVMQYSAVLLWFRSQASSASGIR